jgi:hypothetical protein
VSDDDRPNGNYLRGFTNKLSQLLISGHRANYALGKMIEECRVGKYWRWWSWQDNDGNDRVGFPSFNHWCWIILGFKRRKADTLRDNYAKLAAIDLDEDGVTFSRSMRLGWSKLSFILRVAKDEDALIAWLDLVERENMTWEELQARVRWAVADAQRQTGAEPPEVNSAPAPVETADAPPTTQVRWPVVFESKEATEVVLKAHARIQTRFDGEIGLGKALAMMATHYLATTPIPEEGGAVVEVDMMIRYFEQNYGVKVVPAEEVAQAQVPGMLTPRRRRRTRS